MMRWFYKTMMAATAILRRQTGLIFEQDILYHRNSMARLNDFVQTHDTDDR